MQNLLLLGNQNGARGMAGMDQASNVGNVDLASQQQSLGGGDASLQPFQQQQLSGMQSLAQNPYAGYPGLMQQYFQQQHQEQLQQQHQQQQLQQQQQPGLSGFDPRLSELSELMGFPGAQQQSVMSNTPSAGFGHQAFSQQQQRVPDGNLSDANRLLLLSLQQGQQQQQPQASQQALQGFPQVSAPAPTGQWIGDMSGEGDPYAANGILGPWSAASASLLGKMASTGAPDSKAKKVRKKPKDKPKRPLSAYNIFFKEERGRILAEIPESDSKEDLSAEAEGGDGNQSARKRKKRPHGKIGFENLAKVIGQRWQELNSEEVEYYKKKAEEDMKRYKNQMEEYMAKNGGGGGGGAARTKASTGPVDLETAPFMSQEKQQQPQSLTGAVVDGNDDALRFAKKAKTEVPNEPSGDDAVGA